MGLCLLHCAINLERILHGGKQGLDFQPINKQIPACDWNDRRIGGDKGRGFVLPVEELCQTISGFPLKAGMTAPAGMTVLAGITTLRRL